MFFPLRIFSFVWLPFFLLLFIFPQNEIGICAVFGRLCKIYLIESKCRSTWHSNDTHHFRFIHCMKIAKLYRCGTHTLETGCSSVIWYQYSYSAHCSGCIVYRHTVNTICNNNIRSPFIQMVRSGIKRQEDREQCTDGTPQPYDSLHVSLQYAEQKANFTTKKTYNDDDSQKTAPAPARKSTKRSRGVEYMWQYTNIETVSFLLL